LFWQFYFGETRTGVTLHWMDKGADTGDLLAQAEVPFPDGISLAQAETLTAQAGGELLRRALDNPEHLPRTPQPKQGASSHPRPTSDDLSIPTTWNARRAFNFLRAAREWGPFEVVDESGQRLWVREAVAWGEGSGADTRYKPGEEESGVRFAEGVVYVRGAMHL
jgi:methionyl-tRNA formyltransferase